MRAAGERAVARARGCLGARFRPGGRHPAHGLDCVGLVAFAFEAPAPEGYAQRGTPGLDVDGAMRAAGLLPAVGPWAAGDVLLLRVERRQRHLGIWTGAGLIHADAGLRRVAERPGAPPWPVADRWRAAEGASGPAFRRD